MRGAINEMKDDLASYRSTVHDGAEGHLGLVTLQQ